MTRSPRVRTDDEWLVGLRQYDEDACEDLFEICLQASRFTLRDWPEADAEVAASVAREKIIAAVRQEGFEITSSFLAFTKAVTSRHCTDNVRRLKKERALRYNGSFPEDWQLHKLTRSQQAQNAVDTSGNPDAIDRQAGMLAALNKCFEQLDELDRTIVWLYYTDEPSPLQIAAKLGNTITPNNVGVRRHRALRRLKKCLGLDD